MSLGIVALGKMTQKTRKVSFLNDIKKDKNYDLIVYFHVMEKRKKQNIDDEGNMIFKHNRKFKRV